MEGITLKDSKNIGICYYASMLIDKLETYNKQNDIFNLESVKSAIFFIKKYHHGQTRKSGEPFYSHPLFVASMVSDYRKDNDLVIAAILHDVIEDTNASIREIKQRFGDKIADIVYSLTRIKKNKKIKSLELIQQLISNKNLDALIIKLCDRIHNLETLWAHQDKIKQIKIINESKYLLPFGQLVGHPELSFIMHKIIINEQIRLGIIDPEFIDYRTLAKNI